MLLFYRISRHNAPVITFSVLCIRPCLEKKGNTDWLLVTRSNKNTGGGECSSNLPGFDFSFTLRRVHKSPAEATSHQ